MFVILTVILTVLNFSWLWIVVADRSLEKTGKLLKSVKYPHTFIIMFLYVKFAQTFTFILLCF